MLRNGLLSTLVLAVALGGAGLAPGAALAAGPDFSLSASPSTVSVGAGVGGGAATEITATPSGGFSAFVSITVSGLPGGVSVSIIPAPANNGITELEFFASGAAAGGTTTVTVTGTGGGVTHTLGLPLTVVPPVSDFGIAAEPSSLTVSAGSSATSTIVATTQTGFNGSPTFSASGLPTGVTAAFGPTTTTSSGSRATLTLTAASTAPSSTTSITVTGRAGSVASATTHISLTVTGGSGGGGTGVTVTPVVNSASPWFVEQDVKVANSTPLTALSVTIVLQRTTGISFSGQYNTVGGQVLQSSTSTATTITYQFTLAPGQTLAPGTGWLFAAQASGTGTFHPTPGDTYTATWTTGGVTSTQSVHYPAVDPVP